MSKGRLVLDRGNLVANAAVIAIESVAHPLATTAFGIDQEVFTYSTGGRNVSEFGQKSPPKSRVPSPKSPNPVSPQFKLVFLTVLGITIVTGGFYLVAAMMIGDAPAAPQQTALDWAKGIAQTGVGAIFGLLGGKVTR